MFHVYEIPTVESGRRLAVVSDEDLSALVAEERMQYHLCRGGFRTALDAVVYLCDFSVKSVGRGIATDTVPDFRSYVVPLGAS